MQVFMEETDYKIYRRRLKYQDALNEMMRYHPKYIRNMTSAFLKCQELEKVKLQFYKAFLHSLQHTLDLTQNTKSVSCFFCRFFFVIQVGFFVYFQFGNDL